MKQWPKKKRIVAFAGVAVIVVAILVLILIRIRTGDSQIRNEGDETVEEENAADVTEGAGNDIEESVILAAVRKEKYFLEKNLSRYAAYAETHPELGAEDVVRNVNSNLDYTRYVDVRDADLSYGVLAMINKYNYLGMYEPEDLVRLGEGYTNSTAPLLRREVAEAFTRMADAARSEGLTLMNISGYRSYSLQDWLYETYAAQDGYALADTYSSRPGYSEHQAGLATDINSVEVSFANTAEYRWLQEHAAEYGFILRYPENLEYITGFSYEPWHYRYVGVDAAQQIVREGLTFDEYYAYYVEK